ncbi:unnamed protein product [Brachionus calyciflorus]|uniref:Lipase n=1 Tax=Brachionus calyciflorus TaxID=104777 RepID=A0A813PGT3_9BILA|nr:unnamed protein product [Brachionus calyciflorus]
MLLTLSRIILILKVLKNTEGFFLDPGIEAGSDIDEYINTTTLIESKGYIAEEHDLITQDGYILSINRIINPNVKNNTGRPVVLLQHGLLDSSASWVINFKDQSLGFILSDEGYDVWLGNMRGNRYCLKHLKYHKKQPEFWDFSWSDMGKYDLNAIINYILKTTGQSSLIYIGHSQGTMIGFSEFGSNKDLAAKIKLFIAMGPVTTVKYIKSPIHYIANMGKFTNQEIWYSLFGNKDFLPSSKTLDWMADKLCNFKMTDRLLCMNTFFLFCGPSKYMNRTRIAVYTTHNPSGTSVKNMAHYAQCVMSGKFQMYDYGPKKNLVNYNQTTPPEYDLTSVQVPTAIYWATNDWLADPEDVKFIRDVLPNIVDDYEILDWNHLDFVLATNTKKCLYDRIVNLMNKFA